MAIAGQIHWDNQLDTVSANLVRRRSATCCWASFGETGQRGRRRSPHPPRARPPSRGRRHRGGGHRCLRGQGRRQP